MGCILDRTFLRFDNVCSSIENFIDNNGPPELEVGDVHKQTVSLPLILPIGHYEATTKCLELGKEIKDRFGATALLTQKGNNSVWGRELHENFTALVLYVITINMFMFYLFYMALSM